MQGIYAATRAFEREFDGLFDFVGASAAAIWNMRWQVRGYKDAHPNASDTQPSGHFIAGSGLSSFKFEYSTDYEWRHQEEQIARTALVNEIALYERWLEGVTPLQMISASGRRPSRPRARQICEALPKPGDLNFVQAAQELRTIIPGRAPEMVDLYGSYLPTLSIYQGSVLADLLTYYRFFKELRNQFMHRADAPDPLLLAAYSVATNSNYVPRRNSLPAFHKIPSIVAGVKPELTLKEAFFACYIVRALVRTLDIDYAMCSAALTDIITSLTIQGPIRLNWAGSETKMVNRFRRFVNYEGYPNPPGGKILYARLRDEGNLLIV